MDNGRPATQRFPENLAGENPRLNTVDPITSQSGWASSRSCTAAVWGFAVLWIALATALTVRTMRRSMPFALTWWSLTFPVGTLVTGTTQLAVHTGLSSFRIAAAIAYLGLLGTWCLVAVRKFRGGLRGNIFAPPSPDPIKARKDPPASLSAR